MGDNRRFSLADLSLRAKLVLSLVLVTELTLGGIALIANHKGREVLREDALESVRVSAELRAVAVHEVLEAEIHGMKTFAVNKLVQDAVEAAGSAHPADAAAAQARVEALGEVWRGAPDDDPFIRDHIASAVAGELKDYYAISPLTAELIVTDRRGALVAASERTPDYAHGDEAWWVAAWSGGEGDVYIGPPEIERTSGKMAIPLAVPIRAHGRGQVIGVLKATYKVDRVLEAVAGQRRGVTGRADLVLPGGGVLTSTGARPSDDTTALALLRASPGDALEVSHAGSRRLACATPIRGNADLRSLNRLDWTLVFSQEESDVFRLSSTMARVMGFINMGAIVLAAAVALWLGRRLATPLERLDKAVQKLAAGDLTERVPAEHGGEVGRLARSFNAMAEALEARVRAERAARAEAESAGEAEARARRALLLMNETLEHRIAERTAELAQTARLANEAREAAEAANKAKSTFLATMSHEFRTPLNAIIGYAELLVEEAEDREQLDRLPDLVKIRQAGAHLLSLINDVLDLSRIEADRMSLLPEAFDVRELVGNVVATARPLVAQHGNELSLHFAPDLGSACTDAVKLRQILYNLLSNAAKFTSHGVITLTASREPRDRDWLRFEVTDTGIGMTPEQLSRLFQPFSQADASTTRKYGGTGLGLALSQRLASLLGGYIAVESASGRGSTFTLSLPETLHAPPTPSSRGGLGDLARAEPRSERGPISLRALRRGSGGAR